MHGGDAITEKAMSQKECVASPCMGVMPSRTAFVLQMHCCFPVYGGDAIMEKNVTIVKTLLPCVRGINSEVSYFGVSCFSVCGGGDAIAYP